VLSVSSNKIVGLHRYYPASDKMPFISKDWRSPGEEWVRYEGGWEKRKTVISVPGSDTETENRLSPSLDLAEPDVLISSAIPKKIFKRQSSKFSSCGNCSGSGSDQDKCNFVLMDEIADDAKENIEDNSVMEQDFKVCEDKCEDNFSKSANSQNQESSTNIVAGCRPKIKTKPIIIPQSICCKTNEGDEVGDIKPLKTRYSFSNAKIQTDRLSSTLPRNRSGAISNESKHNEVIPTVDDFSDMDVFNEIDDEYEKINNPLSYHLKQHFRMRQRKRSQRSISVNETTNHLRQSDNEKAQSNEKIECDNNYDVRRTTKDNNVPISNDGCRRDSLNHCQRSSTSPTSNIWLRLIEDEENIGNLNSEFVFCSRRYNFPSQQTNLEYSTEPSLSSSFNTPKPHHTSNIQTRTLQKSFCVVK